jgi:hypothetical protein
MAVIEEAKSKRTESEKEEILKAQGTHLVSVSVSLLLVISAHCQFVARLKGLNVFFDITNSDPFRALLVDRMHSGSHGLGGKHIWLEIQGYIEACGRGSMREVDKW